MNEPTRHTNPFACFDRRYLFELAPAIVAIVTALTLAFVVPRTPTVRLLLAGLVSFALAWNMIVSVAAIRRLDELQQRVHLIAIAVSFAVTGALVGMAFFCRLAFGWAPSEVGLAGFMVVVWYVGVVVLNRRYR